MLLKIKTLLTWRTALLVISFIFIYSPAEADECFNCHTSPGTLIKITREIEKNKPVIKSKSKGPG